MPVYGPVPALRPIERWGLCGVPLRCVGTRI
eukprot:COSAG05_NODE_1194_length_5568_cov_26.075878_6_plen_31_part_00